jgi:hypothetical protein
MKRVGSIMKNRYRYRSFFFIKSIYTNNIFQAVPGIGFCVHVINVL